LKGMRSHSSNSLLAQTTTPSSSSPSSPSSHTKTTSITERIRNARPQLTSRDRVNLFRTSPMKSSDNSSSPSHRHQTIITNGTPVSPSSSPSHLKGSFLSFPSFQSSTEEDRVEEGITARIRRQRDEICRGDQDSPPRVTRKTIQRQNSSPNPPPGTSFTLPHATVVKEEKKERSITRLLAAAGLQRQRKKYGK
jgi:hypothetical protein